MRPLLVGYLDGTGCFQRCSTQRVNGTAVGVVGIKICRKVAVDSATQERRRRTNSIVKSPRKDYTRPIFHRNPLVKTSKVKVI